MATAAACWRTFRRVSCGRRCLRANQHDHHRMPLSTRSRVLDALSRPSSCGYAKGSIFTRDRYIADGPRTGRRRQHQSIKRTPPQKCCCKGTALMSLHTRVTANHGATTVATRPRTRSRHCHACQRRRQRQRCRDGAACELWLPPAAVDTCCESPIGTRCVALSFGARHHGCVHVC